MDGGGLWLGGRSIHERCAWSFRMRGDLRRLDAPRWSSAIINVQRPLQTYARNTLDSFEWNFGGRRATFRQSIQSLDVLDQGLNQERRRSKALGAAIVHFRMLTIKLLIIQNRCLTAITSCWLMHRTIHSQIEPLFHFHSWRKIFCNYIIFVYISSKTIIVSWKLHFLIFCALHEISAWYVYKSDAL